VAILLNLVKSVR